VETLLKRGLYISLIKEAGGGAAGAARRSDPGQVSSHLVDSEDSFALQTGCLARVSK